jgi:hypothetical protein
MPPQHLTVLIRDSQTLQQLMGLVRQHGGSMNSIHVAAAFKRLKGLAEAHQQPSLQQSVMRDLMQQLEQLVVQQQRNLGERELSNIIWASAYLNAPTVINVLLPVFLQPRNLQQASPQGISNVIYAVAKAGLSLEQQQLELLLTAMVTDPAFWQHGQPQLVSNGLWAVATMQRTVPPTLAHQMLKRFDQTLGAAKSQEVANFLWAVATLGLPLTNSGLLDRFIEVLSDAIPQGVSNVLWALGTTQCQISELHALQLLTALDSKLNLATPQAVSNSLWGVASLGYRPPAELLQNLLQRLLDAQGGLAAHDIPIALWSVATMRAEVTRHLLFDLLDVVMSSLMDVKPQDVANTLWAFATMGAGLPQAELRQLVATMGNLATAGLGLDLQNYSNSLWACSQLRYRPAPILAALDAALHGTGNAVPDLLVVGTPADRQLISAASTAYACAILGHSSASIPRRLLQHAVKLVQQSPGTCSHARALANLCWAAAVLDARDCADLVLQLAQACSLSWDKGAITNNSSCHQIYQTHVWLMDTGAKADGLSGILMPQQLQECQDLWAAQQDASIVPSVLQQQVFTVLEGLPPGSWQQAPVLEQLTDEGIFSMDIHAITACGLKLAIEVDGPSHFLDPGNIVDGATKSRNRALAARGYEVVSIPYWEWDVAAVSGRQEYVWLSCRGLFEVDGPSWRYGTASHQLELSCASGWADQLGQGHIGKVPVELVLRQVWINDYGMIVDMHCLSCLP